MKESFLLSPSSKLDVNVTKKIKIAVLASGKGSNFYSIIKAKNNSDLNVDIACLITNNNDSGAKKLAELHSIKYVVLDHSLYKDRRKYDLKILDVLDKFNIDCIVMAGWMRIVTDTLINKYKNRIINIHPSLLPSFKGHNAVKEAIRSKVKITGCTVHFVTEQVDSGEIIIQGAVPVLKNDNENTLHNRIKEIEHKILIEGIKIASTDWL